MPLFFRLPCPALLPAACLAAALAIGLAPRAAHAQGAFDENGVVKHATGPTKMTPRKAVIAPDALPGSGPSSDAAPAGKETADLPPTDALFDAINRGDIVAARDAIGRGADLNGINVLGLTPVDLSVDLGRNSITFLLLSLRDASPGAVGPGAVAAKGNGKPGKTVALSASAQGKAAKSVASKPMAGRQPMVPARDFVSNDPGVPVPQSGFLGFGGVSR